MRKPQRQEGLRECLWVGDWFNEDAEILADDGNCGAIEDSYIPIKARPSGVQSIPRSFDESIMLGDNGELANSRRAHTSLRIQLCEERRCCFQPRIDE